MYPAQSLESTTHWLLYEKCSIEFGTDIKVVWLQLCHKGSDLVFKEVKKISGSGSNCRKLFQAVGEKYDTQDPHWGTDKGSVRMFYFQGIQFLCFVKDIGCQVKEEDPWIAINPTVASWLGFNSTPKWENKKSSYKFPQKLPKYK